MKSQREAGDLDVLLLVKGVERYVFMYDALRVKELLQLFARFAGDQELTFNWYDAAVLSRKVKERLTTPDY